MNFFEAIISSHYSKLELLSSPNLSKFLVQDRDHIMYCERKHMGVSAEWELVIKVFKNKTAINFRDFYIALLALNCSFDSLDNRFCNYLTNKMVYYERTKIEYPILSN